MHHRSIAVAQKDIRPRPFVQHETEILCPHQRRGVGVDGARHRHCHLSREDGIFRRIHRHRIAARIVHRGLCAKRLRDPLDNRADTGFHIVLHRWVHGPHRAAQLDHLWDHVVGGTVRLDRADRHHHLFQRVHIAAGDGLQRHDDMRGDQRGIHAIMRLGGVTALAGDDDLDLVGCGHQRAGTNGEMAHRNARHVVHAVHLLNAEPGDHAILHHFPPATAALLRRLKDHHRGAIEIPRLRQILRRPQQHRSMAVMTASMHLAMGFGGIGDAGLFNDRQRVHICPKADDAA